MRPHLKKKFTHFNRWNNEKSSTSTSPKLRPLARAALPLVAAFTVIGLVAAPASANRRQDAMSWALRQIGCPYTYGGSGPCHNGFDCSGLVYAAYAHVGMGLPRTTYGMLASRALKPQLDHPKPGNLVFFGDGHVTLYDWRHVVLQAPQPGENVQLTRWYPGSDWVPTGYYKIRDAGNAPMRGLAKWVHQMITRYHLKIHNNTTLQDRFPHR